MPKTALSGARIVWVSEWPFHGRCGQSRVTRHCCGTLSALGADVTVLGMNALDNHLAADAPYKLIAYPKQAAFPGDVWNKISESKPHTIVFSHDLWLFPYLPRVADLCRDSKIVGYFTIDGEPMYPPWRPILTACDLLVSPSDYGVRLLRDFVPDVPSITVPYGCSTATFPAIDADEKRTLRAATHSLDGRGTSPSFDLTDKFVVGTVGTNTARKNVAALVDAFGIFAQDKDDVELICVTSSTQGEWTAPLNRPMGADISILRGTHKDPDAVHWQSYGLTEEQLATFYRLLDFYVQPTAGEGFGLPMLEAMSYGVPVAATDYTTPPELLEGPGPRPRGFLLPVGEFMRASAFNVFRAAVSVDGIVQALQRAYTLWSGSPSLWAEYQANAAAYAAGLSWETVTADLAANLARAISGDMFVQTILDPL